MRLFIYGTLKRGHVAHRFLAKQEFICEARTLPEFKLLELGWYPGLAQCSSGGEGMPIEGEVWEVSPACLEELDAYESDEYDRREIPLVARNGKVIEGVEAYVLSDPDWSKPEVGNRWLVEMEGSRGL